MKAIHNQSCLATAVFLFLLTGCAANNVVVSSHNSPQRTSENSQISDTVTGDAKDPNTWSKGSEFEKALNKMSQIYGLSSLKGEKIPGEFELRFWSSPGLAFPTCLIVTRTGRDWEARLLSSRVEDMSQADKSGRIPVSETKGLKPNSGWNLLENLLQENGVVVPMRFAPESHNAPPIPDEGEVFLEVKENNKYDVVGYRAFTENPDGKRALDLCSQLEEEFNVSIGCFQYEK